MKDIFIFGIRPIEEALKANKKLDKVLVQQNAQGENIKHLLSELRQNNVRIQFVPVEKLNQLTDQNHQGIIAYISTIQYYRLEDLIIDSFKDGKVPFFLILDRITDVRNFGSIARTAECMGVDAIIIPEKESAAINADAIKTSAGALFNMKICKESNLIKSITLLQSSGIKTVAATEKAEENIYEVDLKEPIAIILGSEGQGIQPKLLKISDYSAKLPMQGVTQSLNVSVACGAILYEVVRQRLN